MAGMSSNARQVAESIDDLASAVADLTPANDAAAATLLPVAVERAPRLTGRLAASLRSVVRATGWEIVSPLDYAVIVHALNPWLANLVTAAESQIVQEVEHYLDQQIAAT